MKCRETHLVDLAQVDNLSISGSKAFNLAHLARLGIATPGGVLVPDPVFQQHLASAGVLPDISKLIAGLPDWPLPDIEALAVNIRERINNTALPTKLSAALLQASKTKWQGQLLVVRSSAVGEDTVQTSFAGQLESHLRIDSTDAIETALKATWSSPFSLRVLLYARHNKLTSIHMGAIVQPQVSASLSGVLFTRDPTGRHPHCMMLEYGDGLGDRLVNGEITPSRLRIDRGNLSFTQELLVTGTDAPDAATISKLTDIANIGLRLEDSYGAAQDIEWCIDDTGRVVIVQTRPATSNPATTHQQYWSNANIAENFPEPVSPFLFSIVQPGYSAYFRNLGRGFGLSRKRIEAMSSALDNIVGLQGGRLYYNLSNIHSLLQIMPAGDRLVEFFNLFVGAEKTPSQAPVKLGVLSQAAEAARIALSVIWQYLFIHQRIRRFERRTDKFAALTHPTKLVSKSAQALVGDISAFLEIRLHQWNDAALADTAAMVCYGALKAKLTSWLNVDDHSALHNDLLKGLPGLASAIPVTKLWALSRHIEKDPALKALFIESNAQEILRQIAQPAYAEFNAAFSRYLDQWGFRSSAELMLTTPTPVEDPRPLLELLRAYLRSTTASPEARTAEQMRSRLAKTAETSASITPLNWWRAVPLLSEAARFRILLASTQGSIRLRERARMKQALLYTRLRHIALQLGDRMVEQGLLPAREDIFMLSVGEAQMLVASGNQSVSDLLTKIESRRDAVRQFSKMQSPDRLALRPGESWRPDAGENSKVVTSSSQTLHGTGACGGSVSGDATVVLDVANADRVEAGQILVTRQTDPGWATVFFLVHGLVIERGGMLSHGAIIAREYGIPAVVGVEDATRLIRDGDQLRVDGDYGLVEFDPC